MKLAPLFRGLAAAFLAATATAASAQTWPDKPIRIVVPAPAGGALDVVARIVAEELKTPLGQTVIVDNKPGGAGTIAVADLLAAPADGHTILLHLNGVASEVPHVIKLRFDPFNDLKPVVQVSRNGLVLVANAQLPVQSVKDLVAYTKANPSKVSYASYGAGLLGHTLGAEFNSLAGVSMNHVPYKGTPPGLQDVAAGHVQLMICDSATPLPLVKEGRIRYLAVTSPQRLPSLPNVPTFAEQGFPGMTEVPWLAFWTKPSVPAAVQERLRSETLKVLNKPAVRERMATLGFEPGSAITSDEMAKDLRVSYDKQATTLKAINFKPE